ncbi:MAG TPA: alpha/beta fold hydrolase [Steroidobacteraceae bacterium]|nr:alpha/beta fold hydrolase [Steroidobacteraceae bacterium]
MATKTRLAAGTVRLRRMYLDCCLGQLHLTTAFPPSGGFDERTALLFLHDDGGSGADFRRCAALLGSDRSVYAPDLPGSGASDGPAGCVTVANLVAAITDLLDQLGLREVDIFGCGHGALVACELAAVRLKEIRRLIIAGSQQPATPPSQPTLILDEDAALALSDRAEPMVARIRAFLDQAS